MKLYVPSSFVTSLSSSLLNEVLLEILNTQNWNFCGLSAEI